MCRSLLQEIIRLQRLNICRLEVLLVNLSLSIALTVFGCWFVTERSLVALEIIIGKAFDKLLKKRQLDGEFDKNKGSGYDGQNTKSGT